MSRDIIAGVEVRLRHLYHLPEWTAKDRVLIHDMADQAKALQRRHAQRIEVPEIREESMPLRETEEE